MNLPRSLSIAALTLLTVLFTSPAAQGQGCGGCGGSGGCGGCGSQCLMTVVPALGLSLPTGDQGDVWSPGYAISLENLRPYSERLSLGCRLGFQRWHVNAEDLLSIDGVDFRVEDEEGWRALGSASFLVRYNIPYPAGELFRPWLEGGLSANYLRNSGIYVKGFYAPEGTIAVNREIRRDPKVEYAAGLSVAAGIRIASRVQPMVRFERVFSSDKNGFDILTVTMGVFAH